MIEQLKIIGQYLLAKHLLSRLVGKLAAARAGKLTTFLIKKESKFNNVSSKFKRNDRLSKFAVLTAAQVESTRKTF